MRVRIVTNSRLISQAMQTLVASFGFKACLNSYWRADVVVYDYTRQNAPYPAPQKLPTLALISGGNEEGRKLLEQGYVGYLTPESDSQTFKQALESISHSRV
jgi:hypothetical protein